MPQLTKADWETFGEAIKTAQETLPRQDVEALTLLLLLGSMHGAEAAEVEAAIEALIPSKSAGNSEVLRKAPKTIAQMVLRE